MSEPQQGVPVGVSALIPRLFCRTPADEVEFCVATDRLRLSCRIPAGQPASHPRGRGHGDRCAGNHTTS